jgi:hypothetical protein
VIRRLVRTLAAAGLVLTAAMILPTRALTAQAAPTPGAFKPNDRVDADYLGNDKWIPATVLEVENDGYSYKLHGDPYRNGRGMDFILHFKRVRAASAAASKNAPAPARAAGPAAPLAGKYGCTESIYHPSGFEIEQRGFIVLRPDGGYQYLGMGSAGHYRYDAATGVTSFTDGYMDGATATAVDGRRDRMFFVPYARSQRKLRWTCTRVG